ncbi:MAG: hypothetical protein AAF992_04405 [Bacteroidota bacterium]
MIIDLFYRGEALFMGILTLLLITIVMISVITAICITKNKAKNIDQVQQYFSYLKSTGLFTLIFGLFTQLLGLYGAFVAIEEWGSISSTVLSMGLWTSSIPSLYGLLIFLFSHLIRWVLAGWLNRIKTIS